MIKAIAIDNDSASLETLRKMCNNTDFISLEKVFTDQEKGLKHIRKFPVDLVFYDIKSCIDSGKKIFQEKEQNNCVIFTSNDSKYAAEAFDMNAVDFLMKPYNETRFDLATQKASKYINYLLSNSSNDQADKLCVRADYGLKILNPSEILFLESLGDYVTIFLENQKKVITKSTMYGIHKKLNPKEFIRVNRSYIIPFSRIESFGKRMISIAGREISIGDTYRKEISNLLLTKSNY